MNFKPTIFKTVASGIIGLVLAWYMYGAMHICSVAYCYINLFQVYISSLLVGAGGSVFVYGLWSCLQKSIVKAKLSHRLVSILVTLILSGILFYLFFFITFRGKKYFPTPQGYSPFLQSNEEVILPFYVKKI